MAEKKALGEVFDRSIGRWTQFTSFMEAFTRPAKASSQFRRPVAQIIKPPMDETGDYWCLEAEAERFRSVEVGNSWPQPPLSSSSSDDRDHQKHPCEHPKACTPEVRDHTNKAKPKDEHSTTFSDHDTRTISSGHNSCIPDVSERARSEEHLPPLVSVMKQKLPVLQSVKRHDTRMVDYRTIALLIAPLATTKKVSRYISEMVKKANSQIKAQIFAPSDPISITSFLASFKLACDTYRILGRVAMWVLSFFVKNAFATSLNGRMSAAIHIASVAASVKTVEPTTLKKLLHSFPEVANYLLKKFANSQAIPKMDYVILRYTQLANLTPMQYANDLDVKSGKVADV